jgi:hypothetical protein
VQADAEAHRAAVLRAARARTSAIFFATSAGGSPQVRYVSTCSAARSCAASEDPPKYPADADAESADTARARLDRDVLALEADLAVLVAGGQQVAPRG